MRLFFHLLLLPLLTATTTWAQAPAELESKIDFARDVKPILERACVSCHARGQQRGGLSIEHPHALEEGGDSGPAVVQGQAAKSLLIQRIISPDADLRMPQEADPLSAAEVAILRKWIDQGLDWEPGFTFGHTQQAPLAPRLVRLPRGPVSSNPIDRLLWPYFQELGHPASELVDDRTFARRAHLDLIGRLPTPAELQTFLADAQPDKRQRLVDELLDQDQDYALHWMTFWSDALRNAYRGTGYIDGGRRQITSWLYQSLLENKPYDQFVEELIVGRGEAAGFVHGIKWRGTVNESQRREMQAAQNLSQVFLGTNLKCASCHDSFINQWKLKDAYSLAGVFADGPLELHRCNKPLGEAVAAGFIYSELGQIDPLASQADRQHQLAALVTSDENGRFARTIVNRLWSQLLGRGIIEPIDDMDQSPFSADLLDWLAVDLVQHGYDLKHMLRKICTSRAYQMTPVGPRRPDDEQAPAFRGPLVRRMSAEQFIDAVSQATGVWPSVSAAMLKVDGRGQGGQWAATVGTDPRSSVTPQLRAALLDDDELLRALGRPSREQVVTRRESIATTLEALELTNGGQLAERLKQGAASWLSGGDHDPARLIDGVYQRALGRLPNGQERAIAAELVGAPATQQGVEDLLWSVLLLPEFQLIY